MTTKDGFGISNSMKNGGRDKNLIYSSHGAQYGNLNLNQNRQWSSYYVAPSSGYDSIDKKKSGVFDHNNGNERKSTNNFINKLYQSNAGLSSNFVNPEEPKKSVNKKSKANNKSTLSLHISAYENGILDATDPEEKAESIKKWLNAKDYYTQPTKDIQNSFDLPRQQEKEQNEKPETMQFTRSRKILDPNPPPSKPSRKIELQKCDQSSCDISFLRQRDETEEETYESESYGPLTAESLMKKIEELKLRNVEIVENLYILKLDLIEAQTDAEKGAKEFKAIYDEYLEHLKLKEKFEEQKRCYEFLKAENFRLRRHLTIVPKSTSTHTTPSPSSELLKLSKDFIGLSTPLPRLPLPPQNQSFHEGLQTSGPTTTTVSSSILLPSSKTQNSIRNEKVISAASTNHPALIQRKSKPVNDEKPIPVSKKLFPSASAPIPKKSAAVAAFSQNENVETEDSGYAASPDLRSTKFQPTILPFESAFRNTFAGNADETILGKDKHISGSAVEDDDDFESDDFLEFNCDIQPISTPLATTPIKREEKEEEKIVQTHYESATPPPPDVEIQYANNEDETGKISSLREASKIVEEENEDATLELEMGQDDKDDSSSFNSCPTTYSAFIPRRPR